MSGLARIISVRSIWPAAQEQGSAGAFMRCERREMNASEASHSPERPGGAP